MVVVMVAATTIDNHQQIWPKQQLPCLIKRAATMNWMIYDDCDRANDNKLLLLLASQAVEEKTINGA